ncbi:hypothetical protein KVT40_003429 [Elsinoe batatas]|uniref:DUF1750-domain-containing protein n=1 Tax=Elsinoe batatas TaxID=2601811 RepID=A0A8K0PL53_9PEZI|nr:hypothetical protein KVT40_003429 [Elsinoe batatas]
MQDPSYGVPNPLAQHVHLVSNYNFPFSARLSLGQAFETLFKAPQIVKQHATMSWKYFNPPPRDGETFLTWISPRYNDVYPSDGYIWAGQEERVFQEMNGYTIEIAVQHAGYQPRHDAVANHRRARYRLVQKNPNVNAPPPDRNLWLVHYGPAEPQRMMQPSQIPISRLQQVQLAQRSQIESQGPLEQNQFMLHDRDRWPVLKGGRPGSQGVMPGQPGMPPNAMAHMANPRFGGQHYQQQAQAAVGPSPAKRQRTSMAAGPQAGPQLPEYHDLDAEDEFALGDYLDTLSQREVSKARYIQHHEWMEEVFSSPYAINQLEPVYLGFGLMGELAGLTKGVFETVEKAAKQYHESAKAEDQLVTPARVSADQVKDFETKVNTFLDEGQAQIKKMKDDHAKKMEEWRNGKTIIKAEKRLRNARWVEDGARQSSLNGLVGGREAAEPADVIVKEVETSLGSSIVSKPVNNLVERGGLKEKVAQPEPEPVTNGTHDQFNGAAHHQMQIAETNLQQQAPQGLSGQSQSSTQQPPPAQVGQAAPQQQQPPQQQNPSATAQPPAPSEPQQSIEDTAMDFPTDDLETMDTSNFEMEDIDMDIGDNTDFNFNDTLDTSTPQNTSMPATSAQTNPAQPPVPSTQTGTTQSVPAPQQGLDRSTATGGQGTDGADLSFHPTPGDNSAFDEFTAGDGFVDFGDGDDNLGGSGPGSLGQTPGGGLDLDLGLEGSAFVDAFHGSLGGSGAGTPGQGGGVGGDSGAGSGQEGQGA